MITRRVLGACAAVLWMLAGCATARDVALKNRAEADGFLAQNRRAEGVNETQSGLQYKVIKPGDGASPGPRDAVLLKYRGYFIGQQTPFDLAKDESTPTRVSLSAVIEGWREGISLMKEGARYVFYIPPYLAYGERGAPPQVGPNKALIYEIELVKVETPKFGRPETKRFPIDETPVPKGGSFSLQQRLVAPSEGDEQVELDAIGGKQIYDRLVSQVKRQDSGALAEGYIRSLDGVKSGLINRNLVKQLSAQDPGLASLSTDSTNVIHLPDGTQLTVPTERAIPMHRSLMRIYGMVLAERQDPPSIAGTYTVVVSGECPLQAGDIELSQRTYVLEGTRGDQVVLMGALGPTKVAFLAVEKRYATVSVGREALNISAPDQPSELFVGDLGESQIVLSGTIFKRCTIRLAR